MANYCDLIESFCDDMDCDNCPCAMYSFNEEQSLDEGNEIETPAKFRHLETLPLKLSIKYGYDFGIYHTRMKRRHSHNYGRKPRYTDKRRSSRLAPIMARQIEERKEEDFQFQLQMEIEIQMADLSAEVEAIEVDFDQACQEQAEYEEEARIRWLTVLYYDEIEEGFSGIFTRYHQDRQFLMELSA